MARVLPAKRPTTAKLKATMRMVGLDHKAADADDSETEEASERNARFGLWMFSAYFVVYAGYVVLNAFARSVMEAVFLAGINLATIYGLFLILLAFVLAIIYGWVCRPATT